MGLIKWRQTMLQSLALGLLVVACGSEASHPAGSEDAGSGGTHKEPATPVNVRLPETDRVSLQQLEQKLATFSTATAASLLDAHKIEFASDLGYDPLQARNLDLIQASALKLTEPELAKLKAQGFVITPRNKYPTMLEGYRTIYAADLPVYVSLDTIMDAVHVSYDAILKALEEQQLRSELLTLLSDARSRLAASGLDAQTARDLDLYFTVALSLLNDKLETAVFAQNAPQIANLFKQGTEAAGIQNVTLFGVKRDMDFSQLRPRGHYTDSLELGQYFRATMWLGRTDFRLIETLGDGSSVFRRRQFDAVVALTSVVTGPGRAAFDRIDAAITAFVGEHDYMQLAEAEQLITDLGGRADLASRSDEEIAQTIVDKGYGAQRIASQVIFREAGANGGEPLPLSRSFALLGQRYVVDSEVFSNVVYDRVKVHPVNGKRTMPDPLDVAYAALGNSAALPLLREGVDRYAYAPHLESVRTLVAEHGDAFWGANLYNLWLSALRAVSPGEGAQEPAKTGMPSVTGTEAWSRRILNLQLGSWAQLRHDTILYAKQSYTSGIACEFPDGYVDPYPEAFARLEAFAAKGREVAALFDGQTADAVRMYFENLSQVSALLRTMAEQQKTGVPFGPEQIAFLNDAVRSQPAGGCGGPPVYQGWLVRLLFSRAPDDMDPTIADVHTDPNDPPSALHVATGLPRMMVVTRESCDGPRAYVGLAFAYHEIIKPFPRLTDPEWAKLAPNAADVAFMQPILP